MYWSLLRNFWIVFKHLERELGFFTTRSKITKLSIFILRYKSKYFVSLVMSRRPFCSTESYSLYSFIDCCDVAWILLVLQCFFLVVLRGSKSKQQKNCMAIRSNIEMSFHVVESATGSQEAINFVSSLIHVSFALFLISFMEESASHPTSAFPEAECPKYKKSPSW